MSLIFGGLLAGLIGFLVATFAVPDGWPNAVSSSDDGIEEQLSTQEAQIAELTEELRNLRDAPASTATTDLTPLQAQLSGFEATLSDSTASVDERFESLSSFLGGLEERLVLLEERPVDGSGAAGSAAMEAQLEQFRQQLDDVTADAEARITEAQNRASEIEAEAAEAAVEAERRAALSTLRAALENGTSFLDTLQVFDNPPKQLSAIAADGAPTLSRLQSEFPAAARRALSEVRSVPVDASTTEKFTAFLKRQTNARSLAPKDGDDPDAILSRAEAAVSEGDLETATAELSALPDDARAAMSEWISAAETRAAALNAVGTLENTLN
ncbi:MAG: hypothetical protein HKO04_04930 [Silicimonas sp.]|nr:hypothetical protein [Silicimonas sp.]